MRTGPQAVRLDPTKFPPTRSKTSVSVVITSYNYREFLRGSVESVLQERGVDIDVVVVDDHSTDDSWEIAQTLASEDKRVRVSRMPSNCGAARAFNLGVSRSSGDYIVRLDPDDLITPGALGRSRRVLDALPQAGMVYGDATSFSGEPPEFPPNLPASHWLMFSSSAWIRRTCSIGANPVQSPALMFRKSLVPRIGEMRAELGHAHDLEYWLKIAAVSDVVILDGPAQALRRVHPGSMYHSAVTTRAAAIQELSEAFESFADSGLSPHAEIARRTARRTLARGAVEIASAAYDEGREPDPPIDECRQLARSIDATIDTTLAWRLLAVREKAGVKVSRYLPTALLGKCRRWARDQLKHRK